MTPDGGHAAMMASVELFPKTETTVRAKQDAAKRCDLDDSNDLIAV